MTNVPTVTTKIARRRPAANKEFMSGRGLTGPIRRLHYHEVDGPTGERFLVASTLSPEELEAIPERRRRGLLARMLRDAPNPQRAERAGQ